MSSNYCCEEELKLYATLYLDPWIPLHGPTYQETYKTISYNMYNCPIIQNVEDHNHDNYVTYRQFTIDNVIVN